MLKLRRAIRMESKRGAEKIFERLCAFRKFFTCDFHLQAFVLTSIWNQVLSTTMDGAESSEFFPLYYYQYRIILIGE